MGWCVQKMGFEGFWSVVSFEIEVLLFKDQDRDYVLLKLLFIIRRPFWRSIVIFPWTLFTFKTSLFMIKITTLTIFRGTIKTYWLSPTFFNFFFLRAHFLWSIADFQTYHKKLKIVFLLFYQKITQKFKPPVKHFHAQAHPTSKKSRKIKTTPTPPIKHFTPLYSLTNSKTNKINITKPTPL